MANQVTLTYRVPARNVTQAALAALVSAPLVLPDILSAQGVRVTSDVTNNAVNPVTRTIVLSFIPSVTADATVTLDAEGVPQAIVMGVTGQNYIRPPIVTLNSPIAGRGQGTQLRAFLQVRLVNITPGANPSGGPPLTGGAGYVAPEVTFIGGLPAAGPDTTVMCVRRIHLKEPGLGYPLTTTCVIEGGGPGSASPAIPARAIPTIDAFGRITAITLIDMGANYSKRPEVTFFTNGVQPSKRAIAFCDMAAGTPARAGVVTVVANAITAIAVASTGSGYIEVPQILIRDPAATTQAVAFANMQVERVDILPGSRGKGWPVGTTVVFTPFYKVMFPDTSNQGSPFVRFLETAIKIRSRTPVRSDTPVVA